MAQRVPITLENDFFDDELGRPTTISAERLYELPEALESLSEIEAAVDKDSSGRPYRQLEKELLDLAQKCFVAREKRGAGGSPTAGAP